jgi:hypothetical protein
MRNRAKCKKCLSIIESYHATDYVMCKCAEIYVDGGPALKCGANDYSNFLRVDDNGNEIVVKVTNGDKETQEVTESPSKPTRAELLRMLDDMISNIERLPQHALMGPINHYDHVSSLILLSSILRSFD